MPELPEVEIVKRELLSSVIKKQISDVVYSGKKFKRAVVGIDRLIGQTILNIYRRNKYLIFETNDFWLVFHLGMTGNLIFSNKTPQSNHVHLQIFFNMGGGLYFQDPRRFGSIDIYPKSVISNYFKIPLFNNLGHEPLSGSFNFSDFSLLFNSSKPMKNFLLDSSKVCGIGNIYACEIMFLSRVNPIMLAKDLSDYSKKSLFKNIKLVLEKAINLGGSSISDFVHTDGLKGEMQNFYKVYGRKDEPCFVCGTKINRVKQSGRSTYFCPKCQK